MGNMSSLLFPAEFKSRQLRESCAGAELSSRDEWNLWHLTDGSSSRDSTAVNASARRGTPRARNRSSVRRQSQPHLPPRFRSDYLVRSFRYAQGTQGTPVMVDILKFRHWVRSRARHFSSLKRETIIRLLDEPSGRWYPLLNNIRNI